MLKDTTTVKAAMMTGARPINPTYNAKGVAKSAGATNVDAGPQRFLL